MIPAADQTQKRPLLCVDAPAILYRAFFALPDSIRGKDGIAVNALLGSMNMLIQVVVRYQPRAVVICFGAEAAQYRVESFEPYHANRPPMPGPLASQWEQAPRLYESCDWAVVDTDEFEADDLLHSYSKSEVEQGGTAFILTGDRDMFACASPSVTVLLQVTGKNGFQEYGPDEVQKRYGVRPDQVADFIALRGDPSDSIPGAKGIGPKTAANLLQRYETLDVVLKNALHQPPGVRRALLEQGDELRMFKEIATLQTIPVSLPESVETNWRAGAAVLAELGIIRLSERMEEIDANIN